MRQPHEIQRNSDMINSAMILEAFRNLQLLLDDGHERHMRRHIREGVLYFWKRKEKDGQLIMKYHQNSWGFTQLRGEATLNLEPHVSHPPKKRTNDRPKPWFEQPLTQSFTYPLIQMYNSKQNVCCFQAASKSDFYQIPSQINHTLFKFLWLIV